MARRIYYRVKSYFYDSGRSYAIVSAHMCDTRPTNTFHRGLCADVYEDWFSSRKKANDLADKTRWV